VAAVVGHCINIESDLGVPTVPLIISEFYEQVKTHHTIQKGMPNLRVTYLISPVWGKTAEQMRRDIVGKSPPSGNMVMEEIAWFREAFAPEWEALRELYGNFEFKWGFLQWYL